MLTKSYQNVGKKTVNFVKMLNSERCEKCANIVDLKKCSKIKMYLVKWASIQLRASPPKLCSNLFSSRRFWITTITYIRVLTSRPVDAVQLIRWNGHVERCHLPLRRCEDPGKHHTKWNKQWTQANALCTWSSAIFWSILHCSGSVTQYLATNAGTRTRKAVEWGFVKIEMSKYKRLSHYDILREYTFWDISPYMSI